MKQRSRLAAMDFCGKEGKSGDASKKPARERKKQRR